MNRDKEKELAPINDVLNKDRRLGGMNLWIQMGVLLFCGALFLVLLFTHSNPLPAVALFVVLFGGGILSTLGDPMRPLLFLMSLMQPTHYDPGK